MNIHEINKIAGQILSEKKVVEGENGDWKKEGYEISLSPADFTGADDDDEMENYFKANEHLRPVEVSVSTADGDDAGEARIGPMRDGKNIYVWDINIAPEHQRKGLASEMYRRAEIFFKKKIVPSPSQSADAVALWGNKKRKFGLK